MARRATWPPVPKPHATGRDRVRWKGRDYYLQSGDGAAYAALLARLAAEDAAPAPSIAAGPTVAEAVLLYVAGPASRMTAAQGALVKRSLSVLVRLAGAEPAASFGAGGLDRVRCAMLDGSWLRKGERGGPWSARTADCCCGHIKAAWRWLELRGHVPEGRWGALKALKALPKPARKRRRWATRQVLRVALEIKKSPAARLMLLLALWSGCRSGEARGILWSEVEQVPGAWAWRPGRHKTAWRGHERCVMLGPKAQAVLRLARRLWPKGDRVFPFRSADIYGKAVSRAAGRIGLAGFRAYDARHAAKDRVTALLGIDAAKAVLGHANVSMTEGYGSATDDAAAARAAMRTG